MMALLAAAALAVLAVAFAGTTAVRASTAPVVPPFAVSAPAGLATTVGGATPEAVSKKGAVSWALANWNGSYNHFGNDCADFVSRALAYGGGDPETLDPNPGSTSNDHYWYFLTAKYIRWWSHSWSVAHDLAVHQLDIKSRWIKYWQNAQPGDIIFADWSGSKFSGISHVGIITKMVNGEPYITQHSPSQKNVSLNYWLTHGGTDVHVWIASPNSG
jgi:cell wall-associated NlpC family hydrolase